MICEGPACAILRSFLLSMATCPHCKGHLTDSHRCRRRPARVAAGITLAGLAGGFAGLLAVAAFDPAGRVSHLDSMAILAGAAVAIGLERSLRR